mmetsp:Transcript_32471/g.107171  ORF Transcript_32471/g.107171 Transcript_32471/m.107171 type:complete len:284 (+) Transcript_32471:34-885(+)
MKRSSSGEMDSGTRVPPPCTLLRRACARLVLLDRESRGRAERGAGQPEEHREREGALSPALRHECRDEEGSGALAHVVGEGEGGEGDAALLAASHVDHRRAHVRAGLRGEEASCRRACRAGPEAPLASRRDQRPHRKDAERASGEHQQRGLEALYSLWPASPPTSVPPMPPAEKAVMTRVACWTGKPCSACRKSGRKAEMTPHGMQPGTPCSSSSHTVGIRSKSPQRVGGVGGQDWAALPAEAAEESGSWSSEPPSPPSRPSRKRSLSSSRVAPWRRPTPALE